MPLNVRMDAKGAHMILETRAVPPFFKNGFVIGCEDTREGIVIDPGDDVDLLLEAVTRHQLSIKYILLTHAHLDHITGVGRAKQALGVPVVLHRDDNFLYEAVVQQGQMFGLAGRAAAAGRRFYDGPGPWTFGNYAVGAPHARPLPWWGVSSCRPHAIPPGEPCSSATRSSPGASAARICPAGTCRR